MRIPCGFCGGLGREFGHFDRLCPICEGHGSIEIVGSPQLQQCNFCRGLGREVLTFGPACPICAGLGRLTKDREPPALSRGLPPAAPPPVHGFTLISDARLAELRACRPSRLDYRKLIRLCEELNVALSQGCFLAVIILTRSVLDHVPPVFDQRTFNEVANNHSGGRSFKEAMLFLDGAARKIADGHLHAPMRKIETLPTRQQVDFGPLLDQLLAEVIRITS